MLKEKRKQNIQGKRSLWCLQVRDGVTDSRQVDVQLWLSMDREPSSTVIDDERLITLPLTPLGVERLRRCQLRHQRVSPSC